MSDQRRNGSIGGELRGRAPRRTVTTRGRLTSTRGSMAARTSEPRHEMTDDVLAAELATWTGRLLVCIRRSGMLSDEALGKAGDAIAHQFLVRSLNEARPSQVVLSEEAPDDPRRLEGRAVWIIDPLDGTLEYAQGRDDFAVHVALVLDGEATIGAVSLPALDVTYSTAEVLVPHEDQERPLRIAVSRTRRLAFFAEQVAEELGAELVTMGSRGAKAMAVLSGEVDAYVNAIGQHEWDSAAPVAVAHHAGLHASRLDGSPLRFNCPDVFQGDLLVCRREIAPRLLEVVRETLTVGE